MADEQIQGISSFLDSVLDPPLLNSFRGDAVNIQLQIFNAESQQFEQQTLRSIFPFMTIADIKLAIYTMMRYDDRALPAYTFVARESKFGKKMVPIDYAWVDSMKPKDQMRLLNPVEQVASETELNRKFVESNGERRILGITDKSRLLLEDGLKEVNTLYVFFYSDLLTISDVPKPLSEMNWNGRFWPYFPNLSLSNDKPTQEERTQSRRAARISAIRRQFYGRLEESLAAGETLLPLANAGVKYLRLLFPKPADIPGVDAMFYDVPVSERRPYMRLMPADRSPISKIHLLPSGRPNLDDPRLLVQWSQERSPTPELNYALAKIVYRKASGSISPLYFTLRLLDDGTADLTIEPPRGIRRLDPRSELGDAARVIQEGLQGLAYLQTVPSLGKSTFIYGLNLKGTGIEALTTASLRLRLGVFKSVFQEIAPLPGESPLLMLRYKLVSNFYTEDRVGVYISQVLNRRLVRGDPLLSGVVEMVAEEFDLDVAEARRRVAAYLQDRGEVMAVDMESKEYQYHSNAGVDIAIFAQHPLYTAHLYRVDSLITLQRVITLLSLLFSRSPQDLRVSEEAVEALEAAEEKEQDEADDDAETKAEGSILEGEFAFGDEGEQIPPDELPGTGTEEEPPAIADYLQDYMYNVGPTDDDQAAVEDDLRGVEAAANIPLPKSATPAPITGKAVPLPASPPRDEVAEEEAQAELETKYKGSYEDFFSTKLKEADRRLFDYHKTHPSAKKYVTQCGSNLMRQPAVLNQAQYERMMDEYDAEIKSGEVVFYCFPLAKDATYKPTPGAEHYTVMRYGTSEKVKNYYICCRYFCTRDYMLVREKDLRGTTLRRPVPLADGSVRTTKAPMTCPFCEGKVIQNRQYPGVNEVVLERIVKQGTTDKRHLYIKFLGKVYHPEGFHLPCCFTDDQPVRVGHPAFPQESTVPCRAAQTVEEEEAAGATFEEGIEEAEADTDIDLGEMVSYEETLTSIRYAYIIGAEKFPLEGARVKLAKVREGGTAPKPKVVPPQIGLLPAPLQTFFSQDSGELVSRTFNPQKIKPGAQGFLRIGVENRSRFKADSFLAAVAPFFGKNSAASFKSFLETIIQPRVFMAMNYGNFLLEMYDAATARPTSEEAGIVREWGRTALGQRRVLNQELLIRAFMAYRSFQGWLASDETPKEYRHFAHLFLMPGIMATATRLYTDTGEIAPVYRRPGILFIVLDILKSGEVRVRCPPYPVSQEAFERADIGFLSHHWSGVWEPLFFVDNRSLGERDLHTFFLAFSAGQKEKWPAIVKQRLEEFANSCKSMGGARGIYTSQSGIHSTRILPITVVRQQLSAEKSIKLHGIIRDAYNHVAAIVYQVSEIVGPNLVAIPVVDDGIALVDTETRVYLDWDEFEPAPIDVVLHFYQNFIVYPKFPKTYMPRAPIRNSASDQIVAMRLEIGLFVPVAPIATLPDTLQFPQEEESVDEMEWSINRKLSEGSLASEETKIPLGEEGRLRVKEFNEVYEHLRLLFSNWLASIQDGGEFRRALENIIFSRVLPPYEKRKRMEIILGSQVESWLYEADEEAPREASLLRVDCRLRDGESCGGMCEWRSDEKRCLLHVPATSPLEGTVASGARVLLLRLIDELLRFAGKRRQIFENHVSQLAILDSPKRTGDQYIIPETSSAWIEMLRLEWAHDKTEEARYLEEMSRMPVMGEEEEKSPDDEYTTMDGQLPSDIAIEPQKFTLARSAAVPKPTGKYTFARQITPTTTAAPTTTKKKFAYPGPKEGEPTTKKKFRFVKPAPSIAELPDALRARLGSDDPKTSALSLYPSPTGTVGPFLGLFGVYPEDIEMSPRATEFTDADLKALVVNSRVPIVQYDLRSDATVPVIAKRLPTDREPKGYPVFVLRDGLPPSLLVSNPEAPAVLQKDQLPDELLTQFISGVKIFGIKMAK